MSITKTKKDSGTRSLLPSTSLFDEFLNMNWPSTELWNMKGLSKGIPAANIKEEDGEFQIELAIPGFTKKDVHVNLDENVLHVSGETKEKSERDEENFSRKEFSYSSFKRSFVLPDSIDKDNIEAECKEGILKIMLPKRASSQRETKEIDVE
jgi:HSP20 family protein